MCQSKKNGGKRCFTHSSYTKATALQVAKTTGATEEEVTGIMRDLKRAGKDQSAPSAEEYREFVNKQVFNVNNDDNLDTHDKKILTNRWHKARSERPDGGAWHAMKNALGATLNFLRKKAAALLIVGALSVSLAGCGGSLSDNNAPAPTGTVATEEAPAPVADFKGKSGITISEKDTTDGVGEYRQLTLAPDSPLLTKPAKKVWPEVAEQFSAKDVAEAQKTVSNFVVSEGLDSILSDENTKENQELWMDKHRDMIAAPAMKDLQGDKFEDSAFVVMGGGQRGEPVYQPGDSRFDSAKVQLAQTWAASKDELGFQYTFTTKRHVKNPEAPEKDYIETGKGTMNYVVTKAKDGTWDISGWQNDYKYDAEEVTE